MSGGCIGILATDLGIENLFGLLSELVISATVPNKGYVLFIASGPSTEFRRTDLANSFSSPAVSPSTEVRLTKGQQAMIWAVRCCCSPLVS